MGKQKNGQMTLGTERLEAFSDSVFAIVITLLFYNLKVPEIGSHENWRDLFNALYQLAPRFIGIVISFIFVAAFWVSHHQFFRTLKETTRGMLWVNLIFLFLVCFIPFPVETMTAYPQNKTAVVLFGATILLTSVMFSALRYYAWVRHSEISGATDDNQIKLALYRSVLLVVLQAVNFVLAFFFPIVAVVAYVLVLGVLFYPVTVEIEEETDDDEPNETAKVEL